ncbi:MAG: hypothetical protein IPJ12_03515 [Betaproteobacteria bacterium]|nr:hypothetical protein [Betaproteobacteria bacterium]
MVELAGILPPALSADCAPDQKPFHDLVFPGHDKQSDSHGRPEKKAKIEISAAKKSPPTRIGGLDQA